jgi:plastocyanin domain-containing protein
VFFSLFVTQNSKGDRGYAPGLNRMHGKKQAEGEKGTKGEDEGRRRE